jgi:hypothetical protein
MADPAFFNQAFWQQAVVTLFGVFVGLPFALWIGILIYGHQTRHQQKLAQIQLNERRKLLFDVIKRNVTETKLFLQMTLQMIVTEIPVNNVDLNTLEWLLLQESGTINDVALLDSMSRLRHDLSIIQTSIDTLLRLEFSPGVRTESMQSPKGEIRVYNFLRNQLVSNLVTHIPIILPKCDKLLARLDKV